MKGERAMSQVQEFLSVLVRNAPVEEMPKDVLQGWIQNPEAVQRILRDGFCPPVNGNESNDSVKQQLQEWDVFYKKHFRIYLGEVAVPDHQLGFDQLIVVASGLTQNQVYDACAKQFKCQRYADDLDKDVTVNDRDPKNGAYAIWVRDRQEADEENKNLSADQLAIQQVKGITLLERMLYELKYHDKTGKHLDKNNWTLCSGSRYSGGSVPRVYWGSDNRELFVGWRSPDYHNGSLRARSVVSLTAKPAESVA